MRHTFTHFHLHIHPVLMDVPEPFPASTRTEGVSWHPLALPPALGLPAPVIRLLAGLGVLSSVGIADNRVPLGLR